jgi:hypothetical protein
MSANDAAYPLALLVDAVTDYQASDRVTRPSSYTGNTVG